MRRTNISNTVEEKPEIHVTTDYDQFKSLVGNRSIFEPSLRKLIASLEEHNSLPFTPIKVNSNMEVIDGQHRLMAARQLNLPIYYVIEPDADLKTVQRVNANQRSWTPFDYLESFIAQGKKDYVRLLDFMDEYRLSLSISAMLLGDITSNALVHRLIKKGDFVISNFDKAEREASFLNEIRRYSPDKVWVHREFIKTVMFLDDNNIDYKSILQSLKKNDLRVTRRPSLRAYVQQLEDILNFDVTKQADLVHLG
jgi:hypothetical protein